MMPDILNCYIIDDEFHSIENLSMHIMRCPNLCLIGTNIDPIEALNQIRQGPKPDVLFLDINMPMLSGLEIAELVDEDIDIIFITAYVSYAVDAFEKAALDFLLKPISFERFEKSVQRLRKHMGSITHPDTHKSIYINTGVKGKFAQVRLSDIIFIEAVGHYVLIQTYDEIFKTHLGIKDIGKDLSSQIFSRVHKSFIINLNAIKSISGSQIKLQGDFRVPIGDVYRVGLMERLNGRNTPHINHLR
ncbi:LytTR family DNA-binding domain-containing protein [uncultured Pedobacter sp.]|uniref:LytR/AlgR family response regulator transcription factor n=1 Tax=uncultured Pedobacter sp. TaxID=246139 RepID=UPI0025FB1B55|nr:response regulator transcription factor [uncultured Pedobacter sp.]